MQCQHIVFSGHAVQRMFERQIQKDDVRLALPTSEIITSYQDDKPFPSYLLLGFNGKIPIHIVLAKDEENETCHILTVYWPDSTIWGADFKTRSGT